MLLQTLERGVSISKCPSTRRVACWHAEAILFPLSCMD